MCDWRKHPEYEVSETAGMGSLKPNIRRVFQPIGGTEAHRRALVCREVDTNLDGLKDVVRTFNVKGEAQREEADTDYDGRVDSWISFVGGRLAEADFDRNRDGKPDEWKYYADGRLTRIKRDRNFDGKPDSWEVYNRGSLERVGVDETFDGHVDRWDRDQDAVEAADRAEAKARAEMAALADGGAPAAADGGTASTDKGDAGKAPDAR